MLDRKLEFYRISVIALSRSGFKIVTNLKSTKNCRTMLQEIRSEKPYPVGERDVQEGEDWRSCDWFHLEM